jgi:hypothetical protein
MKQFLFKIGVFGLLFLIIDQCFYFVVQSLPTKQIDRRVEKLIQGNINADVLVFGSSRAAHNILAEDLEKQTKLKSFNLGFRGSNVSFHLFLFNNYLKKNKIPKKLIYVVDVPYMFDEKALVFRNDVLLPFVKYSEYRNVLIENDELSKLAYFSNLARFSYSIIIKKPIQSIENYNTISGSNPLPVEKYKGLGENFVANKKVEFSKNKINQFIEFQTICKQSNIELYLVIPPNNEPLDLKFVSKLKQNCLPTTKFYSYKKKYITKNNNYFYDVSHLNKNGAALFTKEVASLLKN